MLYHVYIIYSIEVNQYYIGYSGDDLDERLRKHNSKHRGFTSKANDWKIVYTEVFPHKELALKREKELKSWKSRTRIEKLVHGIPL